MSFAYGLHVWKSASPPTVSGPMSGWAAVEYIIFCCCLWWISYWFLILVTKQSDEWSCRFLALCHGCSVVFSAVQDLIVNKHEVGFQAGTMSEYQKNYLSYMLSYFLFDFIWIHLYGNETWVIYFHHLTSIVIILKVLACDYGGIYVSYGVAGLEFTNPYLQCRWFLRTHGYLNTPIHRAVEMWFFIVFLVIRLIGGSIISYRILNEANVDFHMKIAISAIYIISWVLACQIFMCVKKRYLNRRNEGQSLVDNSQTLVVNSQTLVANSQTLVANSQTLVTNSQTLVKNSGPISYTASQTENASKSLRTLNQTDEVEDAGEGPSEGN